MYEPASSRACFVRGVKDVLCSNRNTVQGKHSEEGRPWLGYSPGEEAAAYNKKKKSRGGFGVGLVCSQSAICMP